MSIDLQDIVVIVIEDNADNLFIVEDLLREELHVKYCNGRASGRQFFKLLESNHGLTPDLILLDIQIPGEDGYAVLQRIRALPELNSVKAVALTANVMPQDIERARQAGFDGFIGKPINRHRFPSQIRTILQGGMVWEPR